jgi:hypothetical protein
MTWSGITQNAYFQKNLKKKSNEQQLYDVIIPNLNREPEEKVLIQNFFSYYDSWFEKKQYF